MLQSAKRPTFYAMASIVVFASWIVMVLDAIPKFQNTAWTDPLAMINVLFPYFWIILGVFGAVCLASFLHKDTPSWLHMLLVGELALMLFYTPFLLSGFSWNIDSLWHGGVADYIVDVLTTQNQIVLTHYAESYPFSFMVTYGVEWLLGINVHFYTLYLYPFVSILCISELAYVFAARLLNSKVAFVSMLLALPALHFIEPHVSPFSAGTILVFASLVLLTVKGRAAKALSLLFIVLVTVTHPISPISLGIYLFTAIAVNYFLKRRTYRSSNVVPESSFFVSSLLFLGVLWFSWTVLRSMEIYPGVKTSVLSIFNFDFFNRLLFVSEWTVGGQSFIFPEIHQLSLAIYAVFLILVVAVFAFDLRLLFSRKKPVDFQVLAQKRMILAVSAVIYAGFGYLLFLSSGERFLLGRGLVFYVIMGSMCICAYLFRANQKRKKLATILVFSLVLFLLFTFPVISYSKEAYNSYTPSSGAGLSFVTERFDLSHYNISMAADQQLASYADLPKGLNMIGFPPNMSSQNPEIVVLRLNSFFQIAMRQDLSFEENSYTSLRDNITGNVLYNKVYSNSKFEVYAING